MGPFLRGFANELIKVSDVGTWGQIAGAGKPPSGVVRPPSTASGPNFVPPPPNASPASSDMLSAIPTQKMESPASTAPQTFRPSPSYKPSSAGDPAAPKAPTAPAAGAPKRTADVPWETAQGRLARLGREGEYNSSLAAGTNAPAQAVRSRGAGYRLK